MLTPSHLQCQWIVYAVLLKCPIIAFFAREKKFTRRPTIYTSFLTTKEEGTMDGRGNNYVHDFLKAFHKGAEKTPP